jgi:adenylate cyclase
MTNASSTAYLEGAIGGEVMQFSLAIDHALHIGRSDKNEVVLDDDFTSRSHAMVQHSGEGLFYITDLGSRNGTLVNGARISTPVILRPGDRIVVGVHEFVFRQNTVIDYPAAQSDELKSTNVLFARSLITVLVADIRDFTGLSQRIDAAKLSAMAGCFFRETGKVLHVKGAWAQKYIGDAVMAVWRHQRREPELCDIIAVLEGLSGLAETASGLQLQFDLAEPVRFGAAIHTGWASVGNAGSIVSSDYTALGETVNRTFRLESSTRTIGHDIAAGQNTYDFLDRFAPMDAFFTPITVGLKGYDAPTTVYAADLVSLPKLLSVLRPSLTR